MSDPESRAAERYDRYQERKAEYTRYGGEGTYTGTLLDYDRLDTWTVLELLDWAELCAHYTCADCRRWYADAIRELHRRLEQ